MTKLFLGMRIPHSIPVHHDSLATVIKARLHGIGSRSVRVYTGSDLRGFS